MIENNDYFMEKWRKGLKSDNLLLRYKAKQFAEITNNVEPIVSFDMDLYFRIVEKMSVYEEQKIIVTMQVVTEIECEIDYTCFYDDTKR